MNDQDFKDFLAKEDLTLIKFAQIVNTPLATVQKWGKSSKVPSWVSAFIEYYYKAKELEELKTATSNSSKNFLSKTSNAPSFSFSNPEQ